MAAIRILICFSRQDYWICIQRQAFFYSEKDLGTKLFPSKIINKNGRRLKGQRFSCLTISNIVFQMASRHLFNMENEGYSGVLSHSKAFKYPEKQISFSHGNLYNLHVLSISSPAKTWLSTQNRIFSSTSILLWRWKFFQIKRASISIIWNRRKCCDIVTSTISQMSVASGAGNLDWSRARPK